MPDDFDSTENFTEYLGRVAQPRRVHRGALEPSDGECSAVAGVVGGELGAIVIVCVGDQILSIFTITK